MTAALQLELAPCTPLEARQEAINRAEAHASTRWQDAAIRAIRLCADVLPDFTADDVWVALEKGGADIIETERNPAAMGPAFRAVARLGYIQKTGQARPSIFIRRHRDLTVWARWSKVFDYAR